MTVTLRPLLATLGFSAALLAAASAQALEVDKAIEYRQDALRVMAFQTGPLGDMVQGNIDYDAEEFALRAGNLAALAHLPWEAFIEGSLQGMATASRRGRWRSSATTGRASRSARPPSAGRQRPWPRWSRTRRSSATCVARWGPWSTAVAAATTTTARTEARSRLRLQRQHRAGRPKGRPAFIVHLA